MNSHKSKNLRNFLYLSFILSFFFSGCNLFNLSVPEYIDESLSIRGMRWQFITSGEKFPANDEIYAMSPAEPGSPARIRVFLSNPQCLDPVFQLLRENSDGSFSPIPPGAAELRVADDLKSVEISILQADLGDVFKLQLEIQDSFGRSYKPYVFPKIVCHIPPEPPVNLNTYDAFGGAGTVTVAWEMNCGSLFPNLDFVTIQFRKDGNPVGSGSTYYRSGNSWTDRDGIVLTQSGAGVLDGYEQYILDFPVSQVLGEDISRFNYSVTLSDTYGFTANGKTTWYGLDQSALVGITLSSEIDNDRELITLHCKESVDVIKYRIDGGGEHIYGSPFYLYAGETLECWSETADHFASPRTVWKTSMRNYVYVDPAGGSDTNGGWSRNTPVKTIDRALVLWSGESSSLTARIMLLGDITGSYTPGTNGLVEFDQFSNMSSFVQNGLIVSGDKRVGRPVRIDASGTSHRAVYLNSSLVSPPPPLPRVTLRNLEITGGTAVGNYATPRGGGIFNLGGTLYLEDCDIHGNRGEKGGGLYIDTAGNIMIETGTTRIRNNRATDGISDTNGGGVFISSMGAFEVKEDAQAFITGNTAGDGGGFYLDGGRLTLRNGSVYNNTASSGFGSGVYLDKYSSFQIGKGAVVASADRTYLDSGASVSRLGKALSPETAKDMDGNTGRFTYSLLLQPADETSGTVVLTGGSFTAQDLNKIKIILSGLEKNGSDAIELVGTEGKIKP
ncbi:right-handed parallel beta-helix repeat-containing protein [Breznakiella homolactica]|uniref:Right-handed parallel beta-helix repeat-containing protein n=1 Tax=Breznakiella homolactica TaxID=2798577 RepID=A0A7T7XPW9_9SPIR|nr:right-handed parallel beta-helix repeat-containing protein [Breznakiella homolactica]QQO10302.1 right-handed parallel beta-helix repeat-containing protein [Breznakiella homolactica]